MLKYSVYEVSIGLIQEYHMHVEIQCLNSRFGHLAENIPRTAVVFRVVSFPLLLLLSHAPPVYEVRCITRSFHSGVSTTQSVDVADDVCVTLKQKKCYHRYHTSHSL